MLCHLDPFWAYWQNFLLFCHPTPRLWLIHFGYIGKIFHFCLNSSHTLWLWSILGKLARSFIFPSAPSPCQALICWSILDILAKHFHFPLTTSPPPYHALLLCSILENFENYFIFLSPPTPSHSPLNTLWLWSIWDILVNFFIFHSPFPFLPSSVTLIRFGHIGKVFHFSSPPPLSYQASESFTDPFWIYW